MTSPTSGPPPGGSRFSLLGCGLLAVAALLAVAPITAQAHNPGGDGDGAGDAAAPPPPPIPVAPGTVAPVAGAPAAPGAPGAATVLAPVAPVDHAVAVGDYAFTAATVAITAGDSVVWTWSRPDVNHSVTSSPGLADSFESHPGVATNAVDAAPAGGTFRHTFATPGSYTYFCRVHTGMKGKVTVAPAGAPLGLAGSAPISVAGAGAGTPAAAKRPARPRVTALGARRSGDVVVLRYRVDRAASIRATLTMRGRMLHRYVFNARPGTHTRRLHIARRAALAPLRVAVRASAAGGLSTTHVVSVR